MTLLLVADRICVYLKLFFCSLASHSFVFLLAFMELVFSSSSSQGCWLVQLSQTVYHQQQLLQEQRRHLQQLQHLVHQQQLELQQLRLQIRTVCSVLVTASNKVRLALVGTAGTSHLLDAGRNEDALIDYVAAETQAVELVAMDALGMPDGSDTQGDHPIPTAIQYTDDEISFLWRHGKAREAGLVGEWLPPLKINCAHDDDFDDVSDS